MRVLIVDDSSQMSLILRSAIEALGHECLTATNGVAGWDLFRQHSDVSVVISDWLMPEMDGRELCRRVRESDRADTYFIFLTSLDDKLHLVEGERAGADAYLTKPIDLYEFEKTMAQAEQRTSGEQVSLTDAERRSELIEQLLALGPRPTTRLVVNNRTLTVDSAITLITQLPRSARATWRWPNLWITPDPFAHEPGTIQPPRSVELRQQRVQHQQNVELIQTLRRSDKEIEPEPVSWWKRLRSRRQ